MPRVENVEEVKSYIKETALKSAMDRTSLNKDKSGCEVKGIKAIHPITGKEVPIFLGDFVLGDYGTGAVMAVPAHDQRDYEYAATHNLDIIEVIKGGNISEKAFEKSDYLGAGCKLINSEEFDGVTVEEAKSLITKKLINMNLAKETNNYKMRDWVFGRQRFWGEPIPMIYCEDCGWVPADEKDLPVMLPDVAEYEPTDNGESPLAKIDSFVNCKCPKCGKDAKRETDTMPQWAGSSWYFLRYMDPKNNMEFASQEAMKYWNRVDYYDGGSEHIARHLLYARFWIQMLYNFGLVPKKEMIWTRITHGMVLGSDNEKMSKSKGNVINPDEIINNYGADALRVYEMFMGDYAQDAPWSSETLSGCKRFLDRVERLGNKLNCKEGYTDDVLVNKTIKKVTEDNENLKYNTAIAALMSMLNCYERYSEGIAKDDYRVLLMLLNPVAPHLTEELNEIYKLGNSICLSNWPIYDKEKIIDKCVVIGIQVNGKLRSTIEVNVDEDDEKVKEIALKEKNVIAHTNGKNIEKIIVVKNRMVNIVVK